MRLDPSDFATLPDAVRWHAKAAPDREALIYSGRRLSYADLEREMDRYTAALHAAGVQSGDRVATLSTPRPEFLLTLLATAQLGALWIGLNPRYQLAELQYLLENCEPKLLFSLAHSPGGRSFDAELRALAARIGGLQSIVTFDAPVTGVSRSLESFLDARHAASKPPPPPARRSAPAVIVYTSGSTGRPKGAVLPHASFFHSHAALTQSFAGFEHYRRAHRIICNLPINHVGCQADICGNALIDGGTIVFMDRFEPAAIPAVIERERITLLAGLPLMHQQVFDEPGLERFDLSSLKAIAWGGAAMPRPLLERLASRGYLFSMHYGLTEGGSINSVSSPGADLETLTETVGWPDRDHDYRVVTPANTSAAASEIGEVQIRGAGVMLGYFRDDAATRAAFTPDGWLRTGDLVDVREDGAWRFVGRSGDMFKSGGYNVYPREIELAIETHPAVASAAVIAVPDPRYDEVGWAFVVPTRRDALDEAALKAHATGVIANYKIPKRFIFVDDLPLLPVGKVDKRALRARALDLAGETQADAQPAPARECPS